MDLRDRNACELYAYCLFSCHKTFQKNTQAFHDAAGKELRDKCIKACESLLDAANELESVDDSKLEIDKNWVHYGMQADLLRKWPSQSMKRARLCMELTGSEHSQEELFKVSKAFQYGLISQLCMQTTFKTDAPTFRGDPAELICASTILPTNAKVRCESQLDIGEAESSRALRVAQSFSEFCHEAEKLYMEKVDTVTYDTAYSNAWKNLTQVVGRCHTDTVTAPRHPNWCIAESAAVAVNIVKRYGELPRSEDKAYREMYCPARTVYQDGLDMLNAHLRGKPLPGTQTVLQDDWEEQEPE